MAFASVGTLGGNNSKAAGTTVVITTSATAEVGNIIVVITAWDNVDTTDGDTTRLSCADSTGVNVYSKVKERTESTGVAADGITGAIFYSVVTSQLSSGGTITVTGTSVTAKAASAWEFTKGAGTTLAVEQTNTAQGNAVDAPSVALSAMPSREYLLIYALAHENGTSTVTQDADYSALTRDLSTGGGAETNAQIAGGYRIATLTGDTNDSATSSDVGAIISMLTAIYEVSAPKSLLPPSYSNLTNR